MVVRSLLVAGTMALTLGSAYAANTATIVQNGTNARNGALTVQAGRTNTSTTVQFGRSNGAATFQVGRNNDAAIGQSGVRNRAGIFQFMP